MLTNLASELLAFAAQHEITTFDEKLFFEVFHQERTPKSKRLRNA